MKAEEIPGAVNVLVVVDDRERRESLREALAGEGYNVTTFSSGEAALEAGNQECFDIIISDLRRGLDLSGAEAVRTYKARQPEAEVILLAAPGATETAIDALKGGAADFLWKPFMVEELIERVGRALDNRHLARENRDLRRQLGSQVQMSSLVGGSPAMVEVRKRIALASDSPSPVLIYGEVGTGKESVAKAIHYNGPRASQRFLAVECAVPAGSRLEAELFGHVQGSSKDALRSNRGALEEASGGTVFLDGVAEIGKDLQAKLLRALDEREVRRLGSDRPIPIDVRFIAASECDLADRVKQGKFNDELYSRLRIIEIALPPLRERTEDIPLLVEQFLKELERERGRTFSVSPEAWPLLVSYAWPGNVRELKHALKVAVVTTRGDVLTPADFPPKVRADFQKAVRLEDFYGNLPSLDELEKRYMAYVLKVTRRNKVQTSAILGINRKTLYRKIQQYKLRGQRS